MRQDLFYRDISARRSISCGNDKRCILIALQSIARDFGIDSFKAHAPLLEGLHSSRVFFPRFRPEVSIRFTWSDLPDITSELLTYTEAARYPSRDHECVGKKKGWRLSVVSLNLDAKAGPVMVALAEAAWC